eukprot:355193-Chlamydomonas_euryale.AAC.2
MLRSMASQEASPLSFWGTRSHLRSMPSSRGFLPVLIFWRSRSHFCRTLRCRLPATRHERGIKGAGRHTPTLLHPHAYVYPHTFLDTHPALGLASAVPLPCLPHLLYVALPPAPIHPAPLTPPTPPTLPPRRSGTLIAAWLDPWGHVGSLRSAMRARFPGATPRQASIIHTSLARLLSPRPLPRAAAAALTRLVSRASAQAAGLHVSPAAAWWINETQFATIVGHRTSLAFAADGMEGSGFREDDGQLAGVSHGQSAGQKGGTAASRRAAAVAAAA